MTRQQRWAKHAYGKVVEQKGGDAEKKYATLCMKAPSLFQQAGLVQAIAFLRTRSGEGKRFVDDLAAGLSVNTGEALQRKAHEAELAAYMTLTHEVIGLAAWFRRFAQAELKRED